MDLIDNVSIAMMSNVGVGFPPSWAKDLLKQVGLEEHMYKKPDQLSGGRSSG